MNNNNNNDNTVDVGYKSTSVYKNTSDIRTLCWKRLTYTLYRPTERGGGDGTNTGAPARGSHPGA